MHFSLDEIENGEQFEELIVAYFKGMKKDVTSVKVQASGTGTDGGRDILVEFTVDDNIETFLRRWVIQCKFHDSDISTNKIADINIPSLIHSYNASGYLLICKKRPTSKLTDFFERLELNCSFKYKYKIWSGEQLKNLILGTENTLWQQFFPKYYEFFKRNLS
ncbi:restriction endonuclease [Emticicia sp. W12TSBA100-4]|uniref:restriction endonuclease n=1 Tax=Emticicia sp. W12TSBA100-4 TaxID=3160965 RepID=UPI003305E91E